MENCPWCNSKAVSDDAAAILNLPGYWTCGSRKAEVPYQSDNCFMQQMYNQLAECRDALRFAQKHLTSETLNFMAQKWPDLKV